jgi:hypothetical protein
MTKNQNEAKATVGQNANAQKPEVKNVGALVTLASVKPQANESGKETPAKIATVEIEEFREAFADSAKADINAEGKTAVCADLFKPIRTWEELKLASRHAIYGYIHGARANRRRKNGSA